MTVIRDEITLQTKKEGEVIDITESSQRAVLESGLSNGILTLFVPGSTASVTTIEFEPGLQKDFPSALARIAPDDLTYDHEEMWHDGNGRSHVKAALLKPDLTVPFSNRSLLLGTWQQIVFVELDVRPRNRRIVLQMIGD